MMKRVAAAVVGAVGVAGAGVEVPAPPETPVRVVKDVVHGVEVDDPYRWLEGDAQGKVTEEVARWTDAQNARTRAVLDHVPGRAAVERRVRELMEVTSVSAPDMAGEYYFYRKREGSQNQAVLYVRKGVEGADRVLLDPNKLDEKGLVTLAWFVPSQDGRLVAFGTYRAGDEETVCHVMEVGTGRWLGDEIPGKVDSGVDWMPDGSGFLYRRLADVRNPYSGQVRFHRIGDRAEADKVLFEQYKTGALATTWGPFATLGRDGRWMVLGYFTGTKSNDLWAVDFEKWRKTGEFVPVEIVKGEDAMFMGVVVGETLYMRTTMGAPNGRVLAVDLRNPGKTHWREVVPERKDVVIESVKAARGMLVLEEQRNAATRIEVCDLDGKGLKELALPGIGSAWVSVVEDRTEAFVGFTSFNRPTTVYRVDLGKAGEGVREVWQRPDVPVDPESVEVEQVWYPSKDGTRVSMFVVHRKGMSLDGRNPTILTGYGGFGAGMTPTFSGTRFAWFEAGGVYAIANLRGGGEYGEAWHEAGMLGKKQNVFDDFIAAGEWLVKNGYTSPEKLAISGGSNGGLLTGAVTVQRPDLFAAAVVAVPLLDMVRYQDFLMARYWVPEYGSSEDEGQFRYLLKYSPYHNVKAGVRYPAVFLTAGENDVRVHPMHARKMAARLQAVAAGVEGARPVLLWVDRESGHGAGKPLNLQVREVVDQQMFLRWQLGMD